MTYPTTRTADPWGMTWALSRVLTGREILPTMSAMPRSFQGTALKRTV